ncbi:surface protease GP63 [Trypanosoma conorhini]|uniref:Leishmanolysin-like peptidase n=1 Tax=Trypanosoma conorhini TaxID=83891 RepID=A0A3R7L7R1_9TRYP|nr:surface protease GP63 [Trypanosoma conorhini]RNF17841.1 surface protease GP63 [Trypanosoma conorhini]
MRAREMLEEVTDVRGNPNPVTVVKSPATLEKTKAHYGCPELQGMELLRINGGAVQPYWSPRNAKDELMSFLGGFTAGYYTALTMAAFEDLGYYKAVWGMEEPMAWGNNSGCDLLKSPCSAETPAKYPGMFCDKGTDGETLRCTSNRQSIGVCKKSIAEGSGAPNETCPVFWADPGPEVFCSVEGDKTIPGFLRGRGSWCLDAEALRLKGSAGKAELGPIDLRAVCAEVQCGEGGTVKVKYLGAAEYVPCPEGSAIELTASEHFEEGAKIKCPKYEEVCTIAANGSSLVIPRVLEGVTPPVLEPPRAEASSAAAGGDSPGGAAAAAGAAAAPDVPAPPTPTAAATVNGSAVQKKLEVAAQQLGSDASTAVGCSHLALLVVAAAAAAVAMLLP